MTAPRPLGEDEGMLLSRISSTCILACCLAGCGGADETEIGVPSTSAVSSLSLATFNAAIGVGLAPYAEQRLDAIERDLPSLGAEVVCLQELWQPEDIDRLTRALEAEFPYTHRSVRSAGETALAACTDAESMLLLACLADNCAEVENAGLPLCAIANCAEPFTQVAASCQQCVAANQSAADVNDLVRICAANDGEAASYEDQTGLLILSKRPLAALDFLELESALGDRGVLSARLDTDFAGPVDVYCTHLAASLDEVPYTGPYGSWQGERRRQLDQLLDWVDQKRAPGGGAVLLGDMNCGPATSLARAASPDAFERFTLAGFQGPYVDADGRCTFCENNPLHGVASESEEGALIDHVLLSGLSGIESPVARRVFDDPIEIREGERLLEMARSDHYGVLVTVAGGRAVP